MSRALWLVAKLALRPWRAHPVRQALTVFAVLLGVALFVSMDLSTRAVLDSVQRANEAWQTGVDLIASRGSVGLAAAEVDALRARPEFAGASGVVQVWSRLDAERSLTLLGVDPRFDADVRQLQDDVRLAEARPLSLLRDPNALVVTRGFLSESGLAVGDALRLDTARGTHDFTIAGALEVPPELERAARFHALMRLQAAQELFGREGRVDRVDLRLAPGVSLDRGRAAALDALPQGASLRTPAERVSEITSAMDAFRVMFLLNELLALLIAVFFVFNTVSAAVAERTRDAGLWRALGMTRRALFLLFIGEALVIGLLGLAGGLALGLELARASAGIVRDVISTIHFFVPSTERIVLTPALIGEAAALALLATTVAAALASLGLARRSALDILSPVRVERQRERKLRRLGAVGLAALLLGSLLAAIAPRGAELFLGGTLALAIPVSVALMAPAAVLAVAGWLRRLLFARATPPVWLALDALRAQPARTALTVTAFALALGLVIGHGGVMRSMHVALVDWLERTIPGDVVINGDPDSSAAVFPFREEAVAAMAALPGVERFYRIRFARVNVTAPPADMARGDEVTCVAADFDVMRQRSRFDFTAGDPDTALRSVAAGDAVLISENLAWRRGIEPGDRLTAVFASGPVQLEVAGAIVDFHNPNGAILMDLGRYRALTGDELIDFAELCLAEGADLDATVAAARQRVPPDHAFLAVHPRSRVVENAVAFIDDLKRLSWAQLLLAVAIGCFGIFATVILSILARTRELALLSAVGMAPRALRRTVLAEVVLLAVAAALLGLLIGHVFFVPVDLLLRQFTGFVFPHQPAWNETLLALAVAAATALASALLPLRTLKRLDLREALQE